MESLMQNMFRELESILEEEGIENDHLSLETSLKALELSSMQFLRVVGALEDLVGVPLDAGIGQAETIGDLLKELVKLKEAA